MAGGFISIGSSGGKNYPGKLTFRVFMTCFVVAFGGLIFGYDLGISGMCNISIYPYNVVLLITHMCMNMYRWRDFHGSFFKEILFRSVSKGEQHKVFGQLVL